MADIFISHSGQDNAAAATIGERLKRERPTWSLFYDKDNIRAGQRWQERLREELQSCRVVLVLLSRNWLGSSWCFAEAVTATFRGKDVVGIETEDLTADDLARAPPILHERQRVRLRDGDDRPWQEILEALDRSGLDPNDWFPIPPNVGPYPGLVAFDERDAGVFFGRKQEITEYLGILDTLRGPDRSQLLVISGASGSGKSSLLRAGLIPRLRRKPDWLVIGPFEVAREPVRNLLEQLGEAQASLGIPQSGLDLGSTPGDSTTLAQVLDDVLRQLEKAANGWVLLSLDQAEVLVTGDDQAGGPEARLLLAAIAEVLCRRARHVVVVATIRTEFMPRLEAAFAGPEVRLRQAPLSTLGSLSEVIEKPAERFGIQLEAGLTERIVEDVRTADALPLLAYTLKALNDQGGADQLLNLTDYQTLGGVQGAIASRLQIVLTDPEPTTEEAEALRRAFTRHLIRVDEGAVEGERLLRRVVPRASLPALAARLLGRLVDAGLLLTKDATIELAHERLIDDWPQLPLKSWLAQDATDRRLIDQLHQRAEDDTLPDGLLAQAEELLQRDHDLTGEDPALVALVQRAEGQKRARERGRRALLAGAVLTALVLAVLAGFAWMQRNEATTATAQAQVERDKARAQLLAVQARRVDAEADTPDEIELAGALALESMDLARQNSRPAEADAIEAARGALIRLPLMVLSQGSPVVSLAELADGRIAGGGADGQIKLWPKDGHGEPAVLPHGSLVLSLAVLPDGRLASGGDDGQIKFWSADGHGEPMALEQGSKVSALMVLPDGRLVSGGDDGQIKIWPMDGQGEPNILQHGGAVQALAVLPDGRLVSGGDDGQIKILPIDGQGEPSVLQHGGAVQALAVLPDGRLASGGDDFQIKIWPMDGGGEPVVDSHGSPPSMFAKLSLAVLLDGRLASAGTDGQIKIWPKNGDGDPLVLPHGASVFFLAVLADGRLASAGFDGRITVWPKDGPGEPVTLEHGDNIRFMVVLSDGRLASAGDDGQIKVWPKGGRGEPHILLHGSLIRTLTVLPDGRLASAGDDGQIKIWPPDGVCGPAIFQHGGRVQSLVALPDGRLASGGAYDRQIKLWPKDGIGEPVILPHGTIPVELLVALTDGRLASADQNDGQIKLWPRDGVGEPVILQHGSSVSSLVALADGRFASAGDDQVKIWPKDGAGEPAILLRGGAVNSLAVLTDGRLVGGGAEGEIKLWPNDGVGEPLVLQHGSPVGSLAALPDGRLASGGDDDLIKLWPKDGVGEPVILRPGGRILSLKAAADGQLASEGDDQIKLWLVDEEKLAAAVCLRAGRNLTRDEWLRYMGTDEPWQPSCRDRSSNWRNP